jgi:hypothetical protein
MAGAAAARHPGTPSPAAARYEVFANTAKTGVLPAGTGLAGYAGMAPSPRQHALSNAIRALSASRTPGCILDASGAFLFVNEPWERLPPEAGGQPASGASLVGSAFVDSVSCPGVRDALSAAIRDALAARGPLPRVLPGEWNDAETARLVSTRIDPLLAADGIIGLVLQRTVVRERPIAEVYAVDDRGDAAYAGGDGRIAQCCCCRRVRDAADPARWEFVPRLAARPAESALELCELCAELHVGR